MKFQDFNIKEKAIILGAIAKILKQRHSTQLNTELQTDILGHQLRRMSDFELIELLGQLFL